MFITLRLQPRAKKERNPSTVLFTASVKYLNPLKSFFFFYLKQQEKKKVPSVDSCLSAPHKTNHTGLAQLDEPLRVIAACLPACL